MALPLDRYRRLQSLKDQQARATTESDQKLTSLAQAQAERNALAGERDALADERDALLAEKDALSP